MPLLLRPLRPAPALLPCYPANVPATLLPRCLSSSDLSGLHLLYPTCDGQEPSAVVCDKPQQLSGWLRLAIACGVPLLITFIIVLVPLTLTRRREMRKLEKLTDELDAAEMKAEQMSEQARKDKVRGRVAG